MRTKEEQETLIADLCYEGKMEMVGMSEETGRSYFASVIPGQTLTLLYGPAPKKALRRRKYKDDWLSRVWPVPSWAR